MATPVEEIKERLNIVDVVNEYVTLKKTGANHKANCPFHNEKTPSFTVSESKQFFHCFGCSKGGDMFTFVQDVEGVEFAEALRMLAKKAGVELKNTSPREQNENSRLLDCLQLAADFFAAALKESKEGDVARKYLDDREVSAETRETFQIGYSADSWGMLLNFLKKKGFSEKEIEQAGLAVISEKTKGYYDRFRGRLMFPIHNAHGNVIGFGGRTLDLNQKEAKYINSPQTSVYNKSKVLYGIDLAKQYIRKMDAAVIVEGYMDVVTAHQAKFRNVVASSGTALTEDQVRMLKRYSSNVILAFDSDAAGLSAAWRGMQIAIQQGMNIKILVMPDGQDPDDLIRASAQEFRDRAVAAKPFMDYAFDTIISPLDLTKVQDKKQAAKDLLPMIALFPDPIEKTHYAQLLAEKLKVDEEVLLRKIMQTKVPFDGSRQYDQQNKGEQTAEQPQVRKKSRGELLSERLLSLLSVDFTDFSVALDKIQDEWLFGEESQELYKILKSSYNQSGNLQSEDLEISNQKLLAKWQELQLIGDEQYKEVTAQQRQQELLTLLESLERFSVKNRLKGVEHELATAEKNQDSATINTLSEEFRYLTDALMKLG